MTLELQSGRWKQTAEDLRRLSIDTPHRQTRERFSWLYEITRSGSAATAAEALGVRALGSLALRPSDPTSDRMNNSLRAHLAAHSVVPEVSALRRTPDRARTLHVVVAHRVEKATWLPTSAAALMLAQLAGNRSARSAIARCHVDRACTHRGAARSSSTTLGTLIRELPPATRNKL